MAFHSLLLESLLKTNLKRVRIKTDPAKVSNNEDFRKIAGYEGFILKEFKNNLKVLVLNPELSISDVSEDMLEYIQQCEHDEILTEFRNYAKLDLVKTKGKKDRDPVFFNLDNCQTMDEMESFLKQNGYTETDLNDLYRKFIENE